MVEVLPRATSGGIDGPRSQLDLRAVHSALANGIQLRGRSSGSSATVFQPSSMMIEGGASIIQSYIEDAAAHPDDPLIRQIVITVAPTLLLGAVRVGPSPSVAASPVRLLRPATHRIGSDVVIQGEVGTDVSGNSSSDYC